MPPSPPAPPASQVGQALSLGNNHPQGWSNSNSGSAAALGGMGGLSAEFAHQQQQQQGVDPSAMSVAAQSAAGPLPERCRVYMCTKDDTLRTVVERLAAPGVRRLIVVHPETRRVEGLISLSDVAAYLFL